MRFVAKTAWMGLISFFCVYFPTPRSSTYRFRQHEPHANPRRGSYPMKVPVFSGTKCQLWIIRAAGASSAYLDGVDFSFLFGFGWDCRQSTLRLLVLPSSTDVNPVEHHRVRIIAHRPWFCLWPVVPYDFVDCGSARWPWWHHVWRCRCGPGSSEGHLQ